MTSKYLYRDPDHNFESVHDFDPSRCDSEYYYDLYGGIQTPPYVVGSTPIFDDLDCENIITLGKRLGCSRGTLGVEQSTDDSYRISNTSWISPSHYTSWIFERISEVVQNTNHYHYRYKLSRIERIQFTEYKGSENGMYRTHTDPMNWPRSEDRKLSVTIPLVAPEKYDGGQLSLYPTGKEQIVEQKKGTAILFASHVVHEVSPVTRGIRYSLVAWIHGPKLS